ncbi:MAG: DUF1343 domain-containing protein [Bacteroidetes bacterium]|nr:DUF1343 domain-containing protein [Bacteroidota bacterium]
MAISFGFSNADGQVKTGIDVLAEQDFELLKGKRVGLVTNPTGVDRLLRSTVDILHKNVDLRALYGPEHGVRGDFSAGDHVGDQVDEATGIPVYSLYGKNRKPGPEVLRDVDVIVYDIQDIGVRSYTYISTMGLVMEAAAEQGKEVVILDRPNPLGGRRIEGPVVEEGYTSFVSQYPIPYIYGLTCGELALLLNGEGMLTDGASCKLTVVPMEGWEREMTFDGTGLQWVPTSPHIPQYTSAFYYPATGIIGELDPNMIGIGYTLPFQTLVTENIDAARLSDSLNALGLHGVLFRPIYLKPYYMARKGVPLQGVQIYITNLVNAGLTEIQFLFLQEAHRIDPGFNPFSGKEDRYTMFDKVCGSELLRKSMMEDLDFEKLRPYWNRDREAFRGLSGNYYLY